MSLLRFGLTRIGRTGERGTEEAAEKLDSDQSADVDATENRVECDSNTDSDTAPQNQSKQKTKRRKTIARKYNPDYLKYGFASNGDQELPLPLLVVCRKTLSNHAMKPSTLLRHLSKKHQHLTSKSLEYFEQLKPELKSLQSDMGGFVHTSSAAVHLSFYIASLNAKCLKPYTIGEELIKPILLDVAREMFGAAAVTKVQAIAVCTTTSKNNCAIR